jgi:hypothetical protein
MLRGNVRKRAADLYLLGEGAFWRGAEAGMATGTKLRELLGLSPLPGPDEIQSSAKQWQNFWRTLNRLNVWCWQVKYSDPAVCDGTGWFAEIVYSDRSLVSSGNNCFPGRDGRALSITEDGTDNTFAKFCRVVARLVGREFH